MKEKPFYKFLDKYTFIKRFDYEKGNQMCVGSMSKLFIVKDKNNNKFLCKRVTNLKYNKNEWKIPNKINTDRVVKIIDVYKSNIYLNYYYYYMIMAYNDEPDLYKYISYKRFKEKDLKPIVKEMALCIKDCVDNNVVHMDIKTENFIVRSENPLRLCLIDFGFSKKDDNIPLKSMKGTLNYCAPEIMFFKKSSMKSDIWSLGAVIYFIYNYECGRFPMDKTRRILWDRAFDGKRYSNNFKNLLISMNSYEPDSRFDIEKVLKSSWLNK